MTDDSALRTVVESAVKHLPPLDRIEVLQRLIAEATEELQQAGAKAHDDGATWAQVAERSGHETASAARRYFVDSVEARRHRERRARLDPQTRTRLKAADEKREIEALEARGIEFNDYE